MRPRDLCPLVSTLMWYSQPLLCLPAFRGVRQIQDHQGHPELQGRQRGRCYLALPTNECKVMISCDCLCILAGEDSHLRLVLWLQQLRLYLEVRLIQELPEVQD